jgi:P-type Ca2+ transporter type 2C
MVQTTPKTGQATFTGLSRLEAQKRLAHYGPNALPETRPDPLWLRFLRQFQSPLIYILVFALVFDVGVWLFEGRHGLPYESFAILTILLFNAALGVWQEKRAENALSKLKALAAPQVWVLREGELTRVPSQDLVPGDMVRLEAGERIPADGRVVQAEGLLIDESVLTGESVPVDKARQEEVLAGTLAVRGKGWLELTRTGKTSAMGRLAEMLGDIKIEKTPLERRLHTFGNQIAKWVLLLAVGLMVVLVVLEGTSNFAELLLFTVALAVAAVPEGLPAVLSLTLALGVERMAKRKAVVRRLSAVEALGSVTVIATDKTGTLTENKMEVRATDLTDSLLAHKAMALASDAEPGSAAGDPLELALLTHVQAQGMDVQALRQFHPRLAVHPFDSAWKFMRVTVEEDNKVVSYLKGAPEVLLERSKLSLQERNSWQEKIQTYAGEGFRLLAFASGKNESEHDLTWLGLAMLWDPPRPEVPQAIQKARAAGIRVLMITGDHPATALNIARQIGIRAERVLTGEDLEHLTLDALAHAVREVNVFARVSPEDKLKLVETLTQSGEIVAMTGDGVNDAPALKRSDVGVAMGQRGSDVSREVADLVLLDDNFATIVSAVEEGRSIYTNIQKFIRFLFSTNVAEVLVIAMGAVLAFILGLQEVDGRALLPLLAVQILWINLVTDGPPALALALDKNPGVMSAPPRPPQSPLLEPPDLRFVLLVGGLGALVGLALLGVVPRLGFEFDTARTVLFHFLAIKQLFLTYPSRHTFTRPLANPILLWVVLLGIGLQLFVGFVPTMARALGAVVLPLELWGLVMAASLLVWGLAESVNRVIWQPKSVKHTNAR